MEEGDETEEMKNVKKSHCKQVDSDLDREVGSLLVVFRLLKEVLIDKPPSGELPSGCKLCLNCK